MMPKGVSFRVGDVAESLQNRRSPVVALQVHDKVRARCNDDEPFHNATITSILPDGLIEVLFDAKAKDGETGDTVTLSSDHVRPLLHEVQEATQSNSEKMRQGGIVFSWDEGKHLKRVPYFIVPDSWAKDAAFVDMVVQGMKLKIPNMVLNFNPIKQPISRWNLEWDYWGPGASSIFEVDEETLPLDLPAGQSDAASDVAKYMAQVAEDRVLDIVSGVAAACVQARAWLQVTRRPGEAGMFDFAPHIISDAAGRHSLKNSVIVGTYCMEDFATAVDTGGCLDQATFEKGSATAVKDRVLGGTKFCHALHKFAGDSSAQDPNHQPKDFVEEIDDVMDMFEEVRKQTVEPVKIDRTTRKKNLKQEPTKKPRSKDGKWEKDPKRCLDQLKDFFDRDGGRAYLPPKDITHLLVFQSRAAADTFKSMLEARVSICNFIMAGSVETMKMFDVSMKTGRPVFVLHGTGGAADMIQLVLSHMKYRKQLDLKGTNKDDSDSDDGEESMRRHHTSARDLLWRSIRRLTGGYPGKSNSRVAPSNDSKSSGTFSWTKRATTNSTKRADDEIRREDGLKNLEIRIEEGLKKLGHAGDAKVPNQGKGSVEADSGDSLSDLIKFSRILWLKKLEQNVKDLKRRFTALLQLDVLAERDEDVNELKQELKDMHSEVDKILRGKFDGHRLDFLLNDTNKDGHHSYDEVANALRKKDPDATDADIQNHMADLDKNSDGKLSFAEHVGHDGLNSSRLSRVLSELYTTEDHTVEEKKEQEEVAPRPKAGTPEELYEWELKVGRAGIKFEQKLGCEYMGVTRHLYSLPKGDRGDKKWEQMQKKIKEMPLEWKLPYENAPECNKGTDEDDEFARPPCGQESCFECNKVKIRERKWLRRVGKDNKPWNTLPDETQMKYIGFWMQEHPLTHNHRMALDPDRKLMAKAARTTFTNVYEPPIEDACVCIDILKNEINIEDIMDDVTSAMSIDAVMNEVGEKKAFRQRLLNAWQMVNQLKWNAHIHRRRNDILNVFIIVFSFLSVLFGTLTYTLREMMEVSKISGQTPLLLGVAIDIPSDMVEVSEYLNIVLPMLTSIFIAMNAAFSPASKYTALYHHALDVESEIYKVRTRVGDYSPQATTATATSAGGKDGAKGSENEAKNDKKSFDAKKGGTGGQPQKKNPRLLFAERVDAVWTDLGASEVRQESLGRPPNNELLNLDKTYHVQDHPSLFEEGEVLGGRGSVSSKVREDTLKAFRYEVEDDGLKVLSSRDYVDIRVTPFENLWANRAQRRCMELQLLQLLIVFLTSVTTLFGALSLTEGIPVTLALAAVFSSTLAYRGVETRLENVNSANVSLRRLMVWWHGLSVIEKRIPANKTSLVNTMESIIQAEAGSVLVRSGSAGNVGGTGAGSGGGGGADGGSGDK